MVLPELIINKSYYMNFKLIIKVIKTYKQLILLCLKFMKYDFFLQVRVKLFDLRDFIMSFA